MEPPKKEAIVVKTPKKPVGRALSDEVGLDDETLDQIAGGTAGSAREQGERDGWSEMVEDHTREIPATIPGRPAQGGGET